MKTLKLSHAQKPIVWQFGGAFQIPFINFNTEVLAVNQFIVGYNFASNIMLTAQCNLFAHKIHLLYYIHVPEYGGFVCLTCITINFILYPQIMFMCGIGK